MPGWAVGPCQYHGAEASWQVAAIDLRPRGRQAKREAIEASGATEVAALEALAALLDARISSAPFPGQRGTGTGRPGAVRLSHDRVDQRPTVPGWREALTRGPHPGRRDRAEPLARPTRDAMRPRGGSVGEEGCRSAGGRRPGAGGRRTCVGGPGPEPAKSLTYAVKCQPPLGTFAVNAYGVPGRSTVLDARHQTDPPGGRDDHHLRGQRGARRPIRRRRPPAGPGGEARRPVFDAIAPGALLVDLRHRRRGHVVLHPVGRRPVPDVSTHGPRLRTGRPLRPRGGTRTHPTTGGRCAPGAQSERATPHPPRPGSRSRPRGDGLDDRGGLPARLHPGHAQEPHGLDPGTRSGSTGRSR